MRDLMPCNIVDLLAFLDSRTAPVDLSVLAQRARELGFEREVFYSLTHLSTLYPDRVPDGLVELFSPLGDTDFLHQIAHSGEPTHTWADPWRCASSTPAG